MFLRSTAFSLLLAAAPLVAQSNAFDIQAGMKSIGRASYTLAPAKQGFKLASRSSYHLNGVDSELSYDFKYAADYTYLEGGSSNPTAQMHTSYTPNKARTDLVVGMVQAGIQDSHHLSIKPNFVLLPPYDAGSAQVVLLLATTHPTPDNLYNVVVPGGGANGGSAKGTVPDYPTQAPRPGMGNSAYDALWTKGPDASGTLDGKPVTLHTYFLTAGKNTWTFFADDANTLMQLDNSMVKASCVRAKFHLALPQ
jgi:hypothetical protein